MPFLPALNSNQIDAELNTIPGYIGALPKDELYKVPVRTTVCAVVNNQNHTDPGSHWVCFYVGPSQPTLLCFDSMGAPPNQNMVDYLTHVSALTGKPLDYSTKQIQELGTSSCGWFCIYILKQLSAGISMKTILNKFSSIPSQNEQFLYRYFQYYHKSNPSSHLPFPHPPQKGKGMPRKRKTTTSRRDLHHDRQLFYQLQKAIQAQDSVSSNYYRRQLGLKGELPPSKMESLDKLLNQRQQALIASQLRKAQSAYGRVRRGMR